MAGQGSSSGTAFGCINTAKVPGKPQVQGRQTCEGQCHEGQRQDGRRLISLWRFTEIRSYSLGLEQAGVGRAGAPVTSWLRCQWRGAGGEYAEQRKPEQEIAEWPGEPAL